MSRTTSGLLFKSPLFLILLLICVSIVFAADDALTLRIKDIQAKAQQSIDNGNIPQAVVEYQKISSVKPASNDALDAQAKIVRLYIQNPRQGDPKAALGQLKKDYANLPEHVKCVHELGWDFIVQKDYDTAIQMYTDLKRQYPTHERAAWFQRSIVQAYLEKGDVDKAVAAVEVLKNDYKNHKDCVNQLNETAERFRWKHLNVQAMDICDYLLKNYPDCEETAAICCTKIKVLLNEDQLQAAGQQVGVLTAGKAREADVKQIHELGWEFIKRKDYDSAIAMYTKLKKQFPNHQRAAWFQRSIVQTYLEKGDMAKVDEAIEVLEGDFKQCPDYVKQLHEAAVRLRRKRVYDKAEAIYAYALVERPDCDEAAMLKCSQIQTMLEMDKRQEARSGVQELSAYKNCDDYVEQVHLLGWEFVQRGEYGTALQMYKGLRDKYPHHERAGWFRRSIAQTYLKKGDQANLVKAIEDMKSNFQNTGDYVHHMEYVSDRLMDAGQYDQAQDIISFIQANEKQVDIWSLNQKIRADLGNHDEASADAALEKIHAEYSGHKDYHNVLCWVAGAYRDNGYYDTAIELYGQLLSKDSDDGIKLRSSEGLARTYARMGDDAKVQSQIDLIHATYAKEHPKDVTFHFFGVGEEYYIMARDAAKNQDTELAKQYYQKAITAWKRQLDEMPDVNNADYIYHIGRSYQEIDEHAEAINYYQQLVTNWPNYKKAWYAQYQTASIYEYLMKHGEASVDDARLAYQILLEKYPTCSAAKIASRKLNTL